MSRRKGDWVAWFWSKVSPEPNTGCWLWTGAINKQGYGRLVVGGRRHPAHRLSYVLSTGPVPPGLELDHLCRIRCCVNPAHLEAVTHHENILRGIGPTAIHARKTHCNRGHELNPANTLWRRDGTGRGCRACRNFTNRKPENNAKHVAATRRARAARRLA